MNRWVPTAVTVLAALVGAFQPEVQAYLAAHPRALVLLGGIYAIVKGLLPSPLR